MIVFTNTVCLNPSRSGPKGGAFNINAPGQEILPRTSALINGNDTIELRFTTSLPAAGRTILGQEAFQILGINLVELIQHSLLHENVDKEQLRRHIVCVENQDSLRNQLQDLGKCVVRRLLAPYEAGEELAQR